MQFVRTLTASMFAATAMLCATLSLAATGTAHAQFARGVRVITPDNVQSVINAMPAKFSNYVSVEICPSVDKACRDAVQQYTQTALVARGGWLGPEMREVDYYVMDPTPTNLQALADACKNAPANAAGAALCKVDSKTTLPVLIMFRKDGTASQTVTGPVENNNFSFTIRQLVK